MDVQEQVARIMAEGRVLASHGLAAAGAIAWMVMALRAWRESK